MLTQRSPPKFPQFLTQLTMYFPQPGKPIPIFYFGLCIRVQALTRDWGKIGYFYDPHGKLSIIKGYYLPTLPCYLHIPFLNHIMDNGQVIICTTDYCRGELLGSDNCTLWFFLGPGETFKWNITLGAPSAICSRSAQEMSLPMLSCVTNSWMQKKTPFNMLHDGILLTFQETSFVWLRQYII